MAGLVEGIKGGIKRLFGSQEDNGAGEATDLNHATSSPPLPATLPWGSASPEQTAAPVDRADPFVVDLMPNITQSRFRDLRQDGKRRTLDAMKAPNPAHGYTGPPATRKKPGQASSWKPVNTFGVQGTNPNHGKGKTYGNKVKRNVAQLSEREKWFPGREILPQQQLAREEANVSGPGVICTSSTKRRKTENPNATAPSPVEIPDDEEDELAWSTRRASTPQALSITSIGSPRSTASKHSGTGTRTASQATSEFANTDRLFDARRNNPRPRRQRSKGPIEHRKQSPADVPFLGAGTQTQEPSFAIHEDSVNSPKPARTSILEDHKQGVNYMPSHNKVQRTTGATSTHFPPRNPQIRIDESTGARSVARKEHDTLTGNLRRHRHTEQTSEYQDDPIQDFDDDELLQAMPNVSTSRRKQSPTKIGKRSNNIRKQNGLVGRTYHLRYFQTHGSANGKTMLMLKHTETPTILRITGLDDDENVKTLHQLNLNSVVKAIADNTHKIRLTGSTNHEGKTYWLDLDFEDNQEFAAFRDLVFDRLSTSARITKSPDYMAQLFKKPMRLNHKIGTAAFVNDEITLDTPDNARGTHSTGSLIDDMKSKARTNAGSNSAVAKGSAGSTRPLGRTVRSTRATAPIHDEEIIEEKEPERYSVTHGLGKRWAKPLDYSVDSGFLKRRKATIEYDDLEKLDEGQMLNDSIMIFYMLYLFTTLDVSIDQVYFFNTHFFPTLTRKTKGQDGINYEAVRSWTKRDDVFSYDYLVVPMHEDLHWYLGIICNVNNIKRKPEHEPVLEDSQDLDHGPASLLISDIATASSGDINSAVPSETGAVAIASDDAVDTKDNDNDDTNLFEEEKELDLIDPNAETADGNTHRLSERTVQDEVNTEALTPAASKESFSKLASGKARQASRKKRVYKAPARDPDKPVIMMLDSLGQTRSAATKALRQWLEAEGRDKRGLKVEIDNKGLYPKDTQIPTQNNYSDCGLYVLGYLRRFFMNPDEFTKKLLRSEMSAESDWPDMDPSKMREDIRNAIFELNEARNGARKEAHKAKKGIGSKDNSASPTKAGSKEVSPALKQTGAVETQPEASTPVVAKTTPTPAATTEKTLALLADAPRLGSPFESEPRNEKGTSPATEAAQKDNIALACSTAQDVTSPSTTTPVRQRQLPAERANSPEVRVPATSPHDFSTSRGFYGAGGPPDPPTRQPADLRSPLLNNGMRGEGEGKLRMPSAKSAKVVSPSKPMRERPIPSSPSQAQTRSGSHDDPISVDDSQDLDAPVKNQSQTARKPPSEIIELDRSQESVRGPARPSNRHAQSSPIRQRQGRQRAVIRNDSIREVDGDDWRESADVSRALKLSLLDEAEQLRRQRGLGAPMEDVFDEQAAYSQSSHTVHEVPETQESHFMELDNDDREIPESPARLRSSPASDVMMMD